MKAITDTRLHRWPDGSRRKPGPRQKFTKVFMVRTTELQAEQMEDRADEEDISVAQLVRSAIEEYLMAQNQDRMSCEYEFSVYGDDYGTLVALAGQKANRFYGEVDHHYNITVHETSQQAGRYAYVAHVRAYKNVSYDD